MKYKTLLFVFLILFSSTGFAEQSATSTPFSSGTFTTYLSGSDTSVHDIKVGDVVNGLVVYGHYCRSWGEIETRIGDIVFEPRADTYRRCSYNSRKLNWTAIMGGDNAYGRNLGDTKVDNAFVISSGANYGRIHDYYVPSGSLSFGMPAFTNIMLAINNSRIKNGEYPYNNADMRYVLDHSSNKVKQDGDKYYGQLIDLNKAIAISKTYKIKVPPHPNGKKMAPIITYLLL